MTFLGALQVFWALEKRVGITPGLTEAIELMRAIKHENNALRRNNERLVRRLSDADDMEKELRAQLHTAWSAARTAQTMAAHWRMQVKGGNYDATKEEQP